MIVGMLGLLLVVLATIGAIGLTGDRRATSPAIELLDGRLARGEIAPDEHRQRRQILAEEPARRGSRVVVWLLGGIGLLLLVTGLPMATAGPGSGWLAGHPMSMGEHMGWNRTATAPADPPVSEAPDLVIEAGDVWFDPAEVELEAGTTVNLALDNVGRVFHDLSIPDLGVHVEAEAGETASTALPAPEPGVYPFLCTVPGHASAGMRGALVVTDSP